MAVVAVLASSLPDARADDLDQPDGHDPLDQQNEPDQRSIDDEPFEQEYPLVDWGTLIDFRFAATDDAVSVLDGGLGKTRYGAGAGSDPAVPRGADLFRLSQLSFWMDAHASETLGVFAHANVDPEPDKRQHRGRVDLIEGFVFYRPQLTERFHLDVRGGVLIPPVSLEHPGEAWTTIYTITPSAVNSWIGEEVRVTGGELNLLWTGLSHELAVTGASFGGNDPTGSLLAFRGWSLHDRVSGLSDRLPLAPIPSIGPGGPFARTQPLWVSPFREIDGRLGYYGAAKWETFDRLVVSAMHFDNRSDQVQFDGDQYAWNTVFDDVGLWFAIPGGLEFATQYLTGRSRMGRTPGGDDAVAIDFEAAYGLASYLRGRHQLSVRYDTFDIRDQDVAFGALDDNNERGDAWTVSYWLRTGERHRLAVEWMRVDSERAARVSLGLPPQAVEDLLQVSFRLSLGSIS